MKQHFFRLMLLIGLFCLFVPINAQDTGVYVTTQDIASLRERPDLRFDRLAIIPSGTTLPALGRTADSQWIQIEYQGQIGWVIGWLLIWTGDLSTLPITDEVKPEDIPPKPPIDPYITTQDFLALRAGPGIAFERLAIVPPATTLPAIGRASTWVQVEYSGQRGWLQQQYLVWTGDFELVPVDGIDPLPFVRLDTVTEAAFRIMSNYERLFTNLSKDARKSRTSLMQINNIWTQLANGDGVSCEFIPEYVNRTAPERDVNQGVIFAPTIIALDTANGHINAAISRFESACGRTESDFFLTFDDVQAALNEIEDARINLNLACSLLQCGF